MDLRHAWSLGQLGTLTFYHLSAKMDQCILYLMTGWHVARVSTNIQGGSGQVGRDPSMRSSHLLETLFPSRDLQGNHEVTPPSGSRLCYQLLCETIPGGFHVLDLKETLHL